jgi:hypothetical protein
MHPTALLADVGDLTLEGIEFPRLNRIPESGFVQGGGTTGHDDFIELLLLDGIDDLVLPGIGTHVYVIFGVGDAGMSGDIFGQLLHVHCPGDINTAVANKNAYSFHFFTLLFFL